MVAENQVRMGCLDTKGCKKAEKGGSKADFNGTQRRPPGTRRIVEWGKLCPRKGHGTDELESILGTQIMHIVYFPLLVLFVVFLPRTHSSVPGSLSLAFPHF